MQYFQNCITQKDAQKVYRFFAKELHPDMGGTHSLMIELQKQYEEFKPYQIPLSSPPGVKDYYRGSNGYTDGDEPSHKEIIKNYMEYRKRRFPRV